MTHGSIKKTTRIIRVPEGKVKEKGAESLFKAIIAALPNPEERFGRTSP